VIDWRYLLSDTMQKMDGISFPRAYFLQLVEGKCVLQHRSQMSDVDMNGVALPWLPLSGPVRILNDIELTVDRLRLVPKKPLPLEGLKLAIDKLNKHEVIEGAAYEVIHSDAILKEDIISLC